MGSPTQLEEMILEQFPLTMTQGALDKANFYAKYNMVNEQVCEAYLFMLGNSSYEYIEDVVLAREQFMEPARCYLTYDGKIHRRELVHTQVPVLGWCHTHAAYSNFFSSLDIQNAQEFRSEDGGKFVTIEGSSLHLYYHVVVNAANDAPYGVIGYRHNGHDSWKFIMDAPIRIISEKNPDICVPTPDEAKKQLQEARCIAGEERYDKRDPSLSHGLSQKPSQKLEQLVAAKVSSIKEKESDCHGSAGQEISHLHSAYQRVSFSSTLQKYSLDMQKNPQLYSSGFSELLRILEGKYSHSWQNRSLDVISHYVRYIPSEKEYAAVQEILSSNTHLRKRQRIYYTLLMKFIEVRYATSTSDPSVGKRKTVTPRKRVRYRSRKQNL